MQYKNDGYDPNEIALLKQECENEGSTFVYFEDEEDFGHSADEYAHFQFVGDFKGQEVIFDAVIYTLRLHHSSLVYEAAEKKAMKNFPLYVPMENRDETYQANEALDEEVELLITELIEEIEENEEIKVAENVEIDEDFEYGIGLDVCLNVDEIDDEVVEKFIEDFLGDKLNLDKTLYSFTAEEEEE
ncbi:MAG: hypothetical protein V4683_19365 [Bacteroidota bacterium]